MCPEDQEILHLLQAKNEAAFLSFYDHYCAAVYGFILRFIENEKLASKICEDVFIALRKEAPTYKGEDEIIFTWVLRTTTREIQKYPDSLKSYKSIKID